MNWFNFVICSKEETIADAEKINLIFAFVKWHETHSTSKQKKKPRWNWAAAVSNTFRSSFSRVCVSVWLFSSHCNHLGIFLTACFTVTCNPFHIFKTINKLKFQSISFRLYEWQIHFFIDVGRFRLKRSSVAI